MNDTACIIKIIKAVKSRECLWNVHSQEYAKRYRLEKAWQEVAQEVGRTDAFCRDKWRNVRTGFLRSIQSNMRNVTTNDEPISDALRTHRKRFYLYEEMSFLLPSVERLEQTKKRRKYSRRDSSQFTRSLNGSEYCENTNTMQDWKQSTSTEQFESSNEPETQQQHSEEKHTIEDTNYDDLLKELQHSTDSNRESDTPHLQSKETESSRQHLPTTSNTPVQISNISQCNCLLHDDIHHLKRKEQHLIEFFRGSIDDILTLSVRSQRLFKRRMLELIEELHESETVDQ